MMIDRLTRRRLFAGAGAATMLAALPASLKAQQPPLARVIIDNDFSGDPDGLFQLAQHVLSPSLDIPLVVGSHLPGDNSPWSTGATTASDAAAKAREMLGILGRQHDFSVLAGSETAMASQSDWQASRATAAIIQEIMDDHGNTPVIYAAGAGLTELALAWLREPAIGERVRLVWIGGAEHPSLATPPPGPDQPEFNFSIDPVAAQIIFNDSDIEIWQVPRDAYRQMLFSNAELRELRRSGPLGEYLCSQLDLLHDKIAQIMPLSQTPRNETFVLGDSPLVTLTALQSFFQSDPSSSGYVLRPTPILASDGTYRANSDGRPMRVYTDIDTRLTFGDMLAKFREADALAKQ